MRMQRSTNWATGPFCFCCHRLYSFPLRERPVVWSTSETGYLRAFFFFIFAKKPLPKSIPCSWLISNNQNSTSAISSPMSCLKSADIPPVLHQLNTEMFTNSPSSTSKPRTKSLSREQCFQFRSSLNATTCFAKGFKSDIRLLYRLYYYICHKHPHWSKGNCRACQGDRSAQLPQLIPSIFLRRRHTQRGWRAAQRFQIAKLLWTTNLSPT